MENNQFNERVNDRISSLLARCDQLKLARDLDRPTRFNTAGDKDDDRQEQRDQEPQEARSERSVGGLPWTDYRRGSSAGGHR